MESQPLTDSDATATARAGLPMAPRALAAFALALLAVLLIAVNTFMSRREASATAQQVTHTLAVVANLDALLSNLKDAETGQRGFLLTRSDAYMAPYDVAKALFPGQLARLRDLIEGDSSQQQKLQTLGHVATQKMDELAQTIDLYRAGNTEGAMAVVRTGRGHASMNEVRVLVDEMKADEGVLLADRQQQGLQSAADASAIAWGSSTLLFVLIGSAAVFASREHRSQKGRQDDLRAACEVLRVEMLARFDADDRLRQLNAVLERRIEERTAALDSNQRRLAGLFEVAHDALVMSDRRGVVVQVNRQAEVLFGWKREELIGQPVEVLIPEQSQTGHPNLRHAFLQSASARAMGGGQVDLNALRKDGTTFPIGISLTPMGSGDDFVITAAVRDTSERTRNHEALRRSEALYRHTLDNILEGCQIVGFDWRYRYLNPAAVRQNRQSRESLIGRTMMEAYPGVEATAVFESIRLCMDTRTAQSIESEFEFPDGTKGWFEISVQPSEEGVSIFSLDITERTVAERDIGAVNAELEQRVNARTDELIQARQAAEAASHAKSAFLATMSHEIRTPMNGVVGMVEVLLHTPMTEDQVEVVRTIRTSAFSLLNIIDDVLDFSKIEAGRLELERSVVSLPELIESVCEMLSPLALDKNVDLSPFISPRLPAQVWSDPTRLRQILFNLGGNAIKFSAGHAGAFGWVSIRADVTAATPPGLILRFADNGIGMTPQTQAAVFSPFIQGETSTTRRFGGTGLGLTICKRLVELLDGEFHVVSELGSGSTFTVTLPIETVEHSVPDPGPDLTGQDCVVVGSNDNARDIRVYLEYAGAHVHLVPDLAAAVRQVPTLRRPVVIQNTRQDVPSADELRAAFASTVDVRHLLIVRGRHPAEPLAASPIVVLDGNCLRRSVLLRAVAVAAGREFSEMVRAKDSQNLAGVPARCPTIAEARAQGRLLLIAEDDEVNQKVILRQLRLLGYAAEIADNGAEVLALWKSGRYALLLTDLHMPTMDGYELARAVREHEQRRGIVGDDRIPILALTANALIGEGARVVAAGMDEYLTKPLQLHLLKAALRRWLPTDGLNTMPAELEPAESPSTRDASTMPTLEHFSGCAPSAITDILVAYQTMVRRLALELACASASDDLRRIGAIAHQLKSSSRAVGAVAVGDLCTDLENACRAGNLQGVERSMSDVAQALVRVQEKDLSLLE